MTGMGTSERAQDSSLLSISTISEDLVINCNVTSKGELRLDGQVHTELKRAFLLDGKQAAVETLWATHVRTSYP